MEMIRFPIKCPSPFYSQGDENRFFGTLYALPEFVEVKWEGAALQLKLNRPLGRDSFEEMIALFQRYGLSIKSLQPAINALTPEARAYFERPESYWFCELFDRGTDRP